MTTLELVRATLSEIYDIAVVAGTPVAILVVADVILSVLGALLDYLFGDESEKP